MKGASYISLLHLPIIYQEHKKLSSLVYIQIGMALPKETLQFGLWEDCLFPSSSESCLEAIYHLIAVENPKLTLFSPPSKEIPACSTSLPPLSWPTSWEV